MRTGRPTESESFDRLEHALGAAVRHLAARADAILVREPLVDPDAPATSDLDLLVVGDVDALRPERIRPHDLEPGALRVDVIWLPRAEWEHPGELAANGVIPHRISSSRLVHDGGGAAPQLDALRRAMYEPPVQALRIQGFLAMGYLTVREIGVTWDFPALALFWLHMAGAAVVAAVADALGLLCPNIYTRPIEYVRRVDRAVGCNLEEALVRTLRLDVDPLPLIPALQRIHGVVSARFPEPAWPATMRSTTRYEYPLLLRPAGARVAHGGGKRDGGPRRAGRGRVLPALLGVLRRLSRPGAPTGR